MDAMPSWFCSKACPCCAISWTTLLSHTRWSLPTRRETTARLHCSLGKFWATPVLTSKGIKTVTTKVASLRRAAILLIGDSLGFKICARESWRESNLLSGRDYLNAHSVIPKYKPRYLRPLSRSSGKSMMVKALGAHLRQEAPSARENGLRLEDWREQPRN